MFSNFSINLIFLFLNIIIVSTDLNNIIFTSNKKGFSKTRSTNDGPIINSTLFKSSTIPKVKILLGNAIFVADIREFQLNGQSFLCVTSYGYVNNTNVYVLNENGTYLYGAKFDIHVNNIDIKEATILLAGSDQDSNSFVYVTDFYLKLLFSYSAQNKMLPFVYFDTKSRLVYTHGVFSLDVLNENFTKVGSIELNFCNGYKFLTSSNNFFYLSCLLSYQDTGSIEVLDKDSKKVINTFGNNLCNQGTSNKTFIQTRFSVDADEKLVFACMYNDYSYFNLNLIDSNGSRIGDPIPTDNYNSGVLLDSKSRLIVGSSDGLWIFY